MRLRSASIILAAFIGVTAGAQVSAPDPCHEPSEHDVIERCGWQASEVADSEMRTTLAMVRLGLKNNPGDLKALTAAQRSWLEYREKTCGFWFERVRFRTPWCRVETTRRRISELNNMVECETEGGGKC